MVLLKVKIVVTKIVAHFCLWYPMVVNIVLSQKRHLLYILRYCDFKSRNLLLAFWIKAQKYWQVTSFCLVAVQVTNSLMCVSTREVTWHNAVKVLTNHTLLPHYCHSFYAYGRLWDQISAQWLEMLTVDLRFAELVQTHAHVVPTSSIVLPFIAVEEA